MSLVEGPVVLTGRPSRRERRRQRRALRERDRASAKLAELFRIDALLTDAAHVVERGWLQNGWFTYVDDGGVRVLVTGCSPRIARRLSPEQVTATCLVGAIVHAAGGPSEASSQLVQRSIDLTWHATFRGARERVRWCPSSTERAGHVMDLVRWNDSPGRTPGEVVALLARARALGRAEGERTRAGLPTG
ncbi:hypothetical protein [Nocardioides sp. CER19]|uniref:DUF6197 family protein n=1 Tax=Nocardioides sp. CER19 TaxID=3038538 RepID=UPI00244753C4|nr:hypothetical protein [Nocardioides sp. CER19]MDH2412848.1 hypothetical protein [Nocardioides sp. CER19]